MKDKSRDKELWKILVVDDHQDTIAITEMVLDQFNFQGQPLQIIGATSTSEAKIQFENHPDTAVILLDVVMENTHSGFDFIKYVRDEIKNHFVRIIIRTGRANFELRDLPPIEIVKKYSISDFIEKTDATDQRLKIVILNALKQYIEITTNHWSTISLKQVIGLLNKYLHLEETNDAPKERSQPKEWERFGLGATDVSSLVIILKKVLRIANH